MGKQFPGSGIFHDSSWKVWSEVDNKIFLNPYKPFLHIQKYYYSDLMENPTLTSSILKSRTDGINTFWYPRLSED